MNVRLVTRFYLGLGAPATGGGYPECRVRAAVGCEPELIRALLLAYRGEGGEARVVRINHRCAEITLPGRADSDGQRFFFKEFPRQHAFHDLERALRLSRVDRAWRAAHLLPGLGIHTPRAVGTAIARDPRGKIIEYLATEWLGGARPFPDAVRAARDKRERQALLREFARHLRLWHEQGVYLRDLVKNVLVTESEGERRYWLTDLDGLHPVKGLTRQRVLRQMEQIEHHLGREARREVESALAVL